MIEEEAIVVGFEKDGRVVIEKQQNAACGQCATPCASFQVSPPGKGKRITLSLETGQTVEIGERVLLNLSSKDALQAAFSIYLLPVAGLVLGAIAGHAAAGYLALNDDALSTLGGLCGLILSLWALRHQSRKAGQRQTPAVILRRLN